MRGKASREVSTSELKLRSELDRLRREIMKIKKSAAAVGLVVGPGGVLSPLDPAAAAAVPVALEPGIDLDALTSEIAEGDQGPEDAASATPGTLATPPAGVSPPPPTPAAVVSEAERRLELVSAEKDGLQRMVAELNQTKQRLSKLYFQQVEDTRKRAHKLHRLLETISSLNAELDLDALLERIVGTMSEVLGFRVVLLRLREPGTDRLVARSFAGCSEEQRLLLRRRDIPLGEFLSWLRDEFKVGHSYLISHHHEFNRQLEGVVQDLGPREEWEWHQDDVLFVPVFNRKGELIAYFSLDDPADRLVPSSESIELLEVFGTHAGIAIENARLWQQLEQHTRELEAANDRMQELQALKSTFISTVSHEVRTPLAAIRAYVDTLLTAREGDISPEQTRRFLQILNEESQRLSRLVESMLDLSRFDSGAVELSRTSLDMAALVEDSVRLLEPVAEAAQVHLKLQNTLADTAMDADRDQIKQLVLHLGSNAVKFTPVGGTVTFRLRGDERDIMLEVEDTGIGIPESQLERVFERFFQVDSSLGRRYGGTGLGLAICKSVVEWHGGRIFAESEEGRGARFTVVLPREGGARVNVRPVPRSLAAIEEVLRLAIQLVAEVMSARVVSLLTPDENGRLVMRAALGLDDAIVREVSLPFGGGVAGWVAEHRRPVCVSGPEDARDFEPAGRPRYRTGTFLSVPIEGESGLLGVLNVTDPSSERPFDAEDCHLLLQLATTVARAWEQARSLEDSQKDVEGATKALRQVLSHLEKSRRRAPDRVRLARATARELGMPEAEVGLFSYAASIHDLGMTGVGERIREGGGPLSPDQRELLESHPEKSIELLGPLQTMGAVRDIVLSHHEWWDGSGYPRGLQGDEIPLGARVLAVVDAFESMTVGRAHRSPFSREDALRELGNLCGRQFDPVVVEAFARVVQADDLQQEAA